MSENKKKREVSNKTFSMFLGIGLVLLSIILIINVGYVARVFAFVPLYLIGMMSWAIFIYTIVDGVFLVVKKEHIHFQNKVRVVGLVIGFIALSILVSLMASNNLGKVLFISTNEEKNYISFFSAYHQNVWKDIFSIENGGYFNLNYLNLFSHSVGGGLLGYTLAGLINTLFSGSQVASYIIASVSLFLAIILFFLPNLMDAISSHSSKKSDRRSEKPKRVARSNESDIIREASFIEAEPVQESKPQQQSQFISSPGYYQAQSMDSFSLARFHPSFDANEQQVNPETVQTASNVTKQEETQPQKSEQPQTQQQAPARDEKFVQLDIFEASKPVYDEQVVTAQPIFEQEQIEQKEAEAVYQQVVSQPITQQVPPAPVVKPRLKWIPPTADLLNEIEVDDTNKTINEETAAQRQTVIDELFQNFKVGAKCVGYIVGPSVTRYNIDYDYNVSVKKVQSLVDDISRRLGGVKGRFQEYVEGETYSGLEVPNRVVTAVYFREVFESLAPAEQHPTAVGLGKDISGKIISRDFADFPHMLVAGTTGSGKSVFVHQIIMSLIMRNSPDDLKLVLIDPKQVEMTLYVDEPHLLCPIIYDATKAKNALYKLCDMMDERYSLFRTKQVLNIKSYNKLAKENNEDPLPYIVVIFDEYADIFETCKDIGSPVVRIAQKARAAGIHLLVATQRPSVNVVTGTIKGNLPTHVALLTSNATDSTVILGEGGAEKLLGRGDMLVQSPLVSNGGNSVRMQSAFVRDEEIKRVVDYLKENYPVNYHPDFMNLDDEEANEEFQSAVSAGGSALAASNTGNPDEDLYIMIKEWAMAQDYISMSRIQREFSMGFNRAGRIFKRLQEEGVCASKPDTASSSKGCRVLIHDKFTGDGVTVDNDDEGGEEA